MSILRTAVATALIAAPSLLAQDYTLTSGGNATYTQRHTGSPGGSSVDYVATSCTTDHVFAFHWCFSVDGSGVGDTFHDLDTHGSYLQAPGPSGDQMLQVFTDVQSLGLFDATWEDVLISTGSDSSLLLSTLTATNTSAQPLTLKLYAFVDIDYNATCCGTTGDFTLPGSGPDRFIVSDNETCGGCMEFIGVGAQFYQCDTFISGSGPNDTIIAGGDLTNTGLPFASSTTPDDFTGALQWTLQLAPGGTGSAVLEFNSVKSGAVAATTNVGVGSGGQIPTISASADARLGREFSIDIGNASGANATLLFAIDAAPMQIPVFGGIQLMGSAVLATATLPIAGGAASITLPIGCNPALGGVSLATQCLVTDATSPFGLPLSASDILVSTIGD